MRQPARAFETSNFSSMKNKSKFFSQYNRSGETLLYAPATGNLRDVHHTVLNYHTEHCIEFWTQDNGHLAIFIAQSCSYCYFHRNEIFE